MLSVRARLTLAVSAVTAALTVLGGWMFVHQLSQGLTRSSNDSLVAQSEGLVAALRASSGPINLDRAPDAAGSASQALSRVLSPDGRVLAASGVAPISAVLSPPALNRALRGQVRTVVSLGEAADRVRLLAVPVERAEGPVVAVVGISLEPGDNAIERVRMLLLFAGGPLVVAVALGARWLAGAALAPVERLRRQVAEMSEADTMAGLDIPPTGDELAALAATMNGLLTRLARALQRERALVEDAGHELRTPLAVLQGELELAGRPGRSHDQLTEAVSAAAEEVDRLVHLAESLLFLAPDAHPGAMAELDLIEVVERTVATQAQAKDVSVQVEARPVLVRGDEESLRRAIENLLDNALKHAPAATSVVVRVARQGQYALIEVLDEGPGFPDAFLPHAFERFRRADPARSGKGGGAGLGLSIAKAVAEAHGGTATAANRDGGGASARILLPAAG